MFGLHQKTIKYLTHLQTCPVDTKHSRGKGGSVLSEAGAVSFSQHSGEINLKSE